MKPYTLICKKTGMVKGKVTCDDHLICNHDDGTVEIVEGHHCFRSEYKCKVSGDIKQRIDAGMSVDVEIATPGSTITITKPADCWIMVEGKVTKNSTFTTSDRDFRATAVGKYQGEIHVVVRSEAVIKQEAIRTAFEEWFKTTPEGQAVMNGPIDCQCPVMKKKLNNS